MTSLARSTGPILAVGGISFARGFILDGADPDWRIVAGTAVAAAMFAGAERVFPEAVPALAWLALVTVVFVRIDPRTPAPAEALMTFLKG